MLIATSVAVKVTAVTKPGKALSYEAFQREATVVNGFMPSTSSH